MGASTEAFVHAALDLVGQPYSKMDCQEFVEQAMKAVGINLNLAGSNTWYRNMTWTGTPEECIATFGEIPVGAILFILKHDGKEPAAYRSDGKGNADHMGIKTYVSPGSVHSSSIKKKVIESTFEDKTIRNGGWNAVGLWDAFDYGETINRILKGEEKPLSQTAKVVAESGKTVNFRTGPSTSSALIDRIDIGTSVQVISDFGTWVKVLIGSKTGYIMANYIDYDMPDDTSDDPAWVDKVKQARILLDEALMGV